MSILLHFFSETRTFFTKTFPYYPYPQNVYNNLCPVCQISRSRDQNKEGSWKKISTRKKLILVFQIKFSIHLFPRQLCSRLSISQLCFPFDIRLPMCTHKKLTTKITQSCRKSFEKMFRLPFLTDAIRKIAIIAFVILI